jgi:hypothetical protein
MRRTKFIVAIGSVMMSMAASAHAVIDPVAGTFSNFVAGNGGLVWVQFLLFNAGL